MLKDLLARALADGLGKIDIKKILTGAGMAAAGAVAAYLATVAETLDDSSLSGAIATAVVAVIINVLRKLIDGKKE